MKKLLPILLTIVCAVSAFGQSRKPQLKSKPKPRPQTQTPPRVGSPSASGEIKFQPILKVSVLKTNGEKIDGLFVSGDTRTITVEVSGKNMPINLSEVTSLNFAAVHKTVLGAVNFSSGNFNAIENSNPQGIANPVGTVSGGVVNAKAAILPIPAYPAAARAVHASGAVSVQVLIDERGDVISAAAISGHPLLRTAATEAAKQAKFAPTILNDQPVKVSGIIVYNFVP